MEDFVLSAGGKLSYATITGGTIGTYNDLKACTQLPQIGSAPDTVDTTSLDNLKYRTATPGLQELGVLDFPFNLENPAAAANINTIASLNENTLYSWKVTKASGITHVFPAKPRYSFNEVGVNQLESFTLHLMPEDEIVTTIPASV